jgi:hypothetical protein
MKSVLGATSESDLSIARPIAKVVNGVAWMFIPAFNISCVRIVRKTGYIGVVYVVISIAELLLVTSNIYGVLSSGKATPESLALSSVNPELITGVLLKPA